MNRIGALALTLIVGMVANPACHAQSQDPVPPRLSVSKALFLQNNPAARIQLLSHLPRQPAGPPQVALQAVSSAFGGTWQTTAQAPASGLTNPLLLTDGSVIFLDYLTGAWYKLTPDNTGSYVNGTWSQIASLPSGYSPLYFASAVLPDGRAIIMGGEYNGNFNAGPVWTSLGAIYDPVANTWTSVSPPTGSGWTNASPVGSCNGGIGDAASVVLPNGTFMLGASCAAPPLDALLNATTLGWSSTGVPNSYQDQQGYTLLQSGKVLTVDVWNPPAAQQYDPGTGLWTAIASTPVSLVDPAACGNDAMGPAVMRPDGTVVAFGGNTGCTASPTNPTAIYTPSSNSWIAGPNLPAVCGSNGRTSCTLANAPAAMLPNGNILFAASAGYLSAPTHFFEFTSANAINQVADDVNFASSSSAYYYNFLVLPNGQVLATDTSSSVEIYTPTGAANSAWAPAITSVASCVTPGSSYALSGTQLNGLSQGAASGEAVQGASNYPLVGIVNNATQHVFYARTSGHSTMSIAPGQAGSTNFQVASATETGASTLYVVANGISSVGVAITVSSSCSSSPPALEVTPSTNIAASGTQGGPFSPSSFSYTLSATSGSVNYSISGVPSWLTPSATSGAASSGTTVTFTVNANANSLVANTYNATITFTNSDTGKGSQTRTAALSVNSPALLVAPATNIATSGTQGGPFSPSAFSYTLRATSGSMNYSITNVPSWLTPSSTSGTVTTSAKTIIFMINSKASKLSPNTYVSGVNINSATRLATLTVSPPQKHRRGSNQLVAADKGE